MTTILRIDSSAQLEERSLTRNLTSLFVRDFLRFQPESKIIVRDVGCEPIPAIDHHFIHAAFTPLSERETWMKERLSLSDQLISEIEQADIIVLGAPMYNYGMPAALKAWVDQVARIDRTFTFDLRRGDFPIEPVLKNKVLVVLSSRGEFGFEDGGLRAHLNSLDRGIAACAHYLGVDANSIETVAIEYQEFKDSRHRASLLAAEERTADLARRLASEVSRKGL